MNKPGSERILKRNSAVSRIPSRAESLCLSRAAYLRGGMRENTESELGSAAVFLTTNLGMATSTYSLLYKLKENTNSLISSSDWFLPWNRIHPYLILSWPGMSTTVTFFPVVGVWKCPRFSCIEVKVSTPDLPAVTRRLKIRVLPPSQGPAMRTALRRPDFFLKINKKSFV